MKKTLMSCLLACAASLSAAESIYTVTDTVLRADPPNFGTNMTFPNFRPWAEGPRLWNNWGPWYSMEPIVFRHNGQATGGGADFIEDEKGSAKALIGEGIEVKSSGSGYWFLHGDGFWDGATVDIYRETEDSVECIRSTTVKKFYGSKGSPGRIELVDSGEPIQQGDLYVLTMKRLKTPAVSGPSEKMTRTQQLSNFVKTNKKFQGKIPWTLDDTTFCSENGSTASMKITLPGGHTGNEKKEGLPSGWEFQFIRNGGKELDFNREEGVTYRCDIWLKQEGIAGPVTLKLGDRLHEQIEVNAEWKKYSFSIPTDTPISDSFNDCISVIGSKHPGTLWIDNFAIYQEGVEPFAVYPEWKEELKKWKPGIMRTMIGRGLLTVDALLTHGFTRNFLWSPKSGLHTGWGQGNFGLPQYLSLCEEVGAEPYVLTYMLYTDKEIEQLMEYLGAPADTGYGKLRAEHGHPKPWVESFDQIYIECANEMWNGNFAPQAFPRQPEMAGKVSNRLYRAMKNSTWNTRKNIKFVASAFVNSLYRWKDRKTGEFNMEDRAKAWTFRCVENTSEADAIATAPSGYIGGWDGDTIIGENDAELFQGNLFYPARIMHPKLKDIKALYKELGRELEMIKYEAGPGYALPNPKVPVIPEEEATQKTLALSTATLDNFLFVLANNGNSNYFKTRTGNKWSSHNNDMVPHTTWLALSLRNQYCKGALLAVEETQLATVDLPEMTVTTLKNDGSKRPKKVAAMNNVPWTRLYAFREGKRYSYIAVNRSFTETQDITIQVPYQAKSAVTRYLLTGDPRDTNIQEAKVLIEELKGNNFGKSYTFSLPPASSCVVINEAE